MTRTLTRTSRRFKFCALIFALISLAVVAERALMSRAGATPTTPVMFATQTVTSLGDTDVNAPGCGDGCSLREAIETAIANDTINFQAGLIGTIKLKMGELVIDKNLTITGPGANLLTVSGNNASRVFFVNSGVTATINDLTIANGNGVGANVSGSGGGIRNEGTLTLNRSTVANNIAGGLGGGIRNAVGTLTVRDCTISSNTTNSSTAGGGIDSDATLRVINSTISGNQANNGDGNGGGIFAGGSTTTLVNSTITGNQAAGASGTGGIRHFGGTVTIQNTIVAGNTNTSSPSEDVNGTFTSGGFNLIGDDTFSTGFTNGVNGDQVGMSGAPIDPKLSPLQYNGGPTRTHRLLPTSPAIDNGSDALAVDPSNSNAALMTDQRGAPRISNTTVDIGAFEVLVRETAGMIQLAFNPTTDQTVAVIELIEAIHAANDDIELTTIKMLNGTYTLTAYNNTAYGPNGLPIIKSEIAIEGEGAVIARSSAAGTPAFRLFFVSDETGGGAVYGILSLKNLVLSNGFARGGDGGKSSTPFTSGGGGAAGAGGAILNFGTLSIENSTLVGNKAQGGDGGGGADNGPNGNGSGGGGGAGGNGADGGLTGNGGGGGTGGNGGMGSGNGAGGGGGGTMFDGGDANGSVGGFGGVENGGNGGLNDSLNGMNATGPGGGGGGDSFFGFGGDGQTGGGGGGGAACGGSSVSSFGGRGIFGGGGGGLVPTTDDPFKTCGLGGFGGGNGGGQPNSAKFGGNGGVTGDATGAGGGGGAGLGGAIFNYGYVTMTNSTFSGNQAIGGKGGTVTTSGENGQGIGGGIFGANSGVETNHVTFKDNIAADGGGGIYLTIDSEGFVYLNLNNTIIYGNTGDASDCFLTDAADSNGDFNLIGKNNGCPGVRFTSDPMLGPLQPNGGLTPTHELLSGSPAIDQGGPPEIEGTDPPNDQRLVTRPVDFAGIPNQPDGNGSDIGAFEVQVACQDITINPATLPSGVAGIPYELMLTATGGTPAYTFLVVEGMLPPGLMLSSSGAITGTPTTPGTSNNITIEVTDSKGCKGTRIYSLIINTKPAVLIADPFACTGPGDALNVILTITNSAAIAQTVNATATLQTGLTALPGTASATVGMAVVTNASTVNYGGTLAPGQTATVTYQVQVGTGIAANTTLCIDTVATFSTGATATVQACTTVNCPTVGPGTPPPAAAAVSDQKPGSVLFYNLYTSNPANLTQQNSRINITNTDPSRSVAVHLFFVDGATCSPADVFICLTPNQTMSFLASDIDPGTTGYIVAVAADSVTGCPINFNFLIGDAFIKLASGHQANLGAEAFSALSLTAPICSAGSATATLNFDGVSYNQVPRVLAVDNFPSVADGNNTLVILNRVGGNLLSGASSIGSLFGVLYDEAEQPLSFSLSSNACQFRFPLTNASLRTVPRVETMVGAGRTGWLRLWGVLDVGLLGAMINFNPTAGVNNFNQGHNLHKLTFTSASLTVPIIPPNCQ